MRTGSLLQFDVPNLCVLPSHTDLFRRRFQSALRNCVRRGFSVAECFGVIWVETLEEINLSEHEQHELYDELIVWARHLAA
jgi:hypothetical protein